MALFKDKFEGRLDDTPQPTLNEVNFSTSLIDFKKAVEPQIAKTYIDLAKHCKAKVLNSNSFQNITTSMSVESLNPSMRGFKDCNSIYSLLYQHRKVSQLSNCSLII